MRTYLAKRICQFHQSPCYFSTEQRFGSRRHDAGPANQVQCVRGITTSNKELEASADTSKLA